MRRLYPCGHLAHYWVLTTLTVNAALVVADYRAELADGLALLEALPRQLIPADAATADEVREEMALAVGVLHGFTELIAGLKEGFADPDAVHIPVLQK